METRVRQPDIATAPHVVLLEADEGRDLAARDDAGALPVESW